MARLAPGGGRRNSLAPLKMRDVVMLDKFVEVKEAAIAEHATERSWIKMKAVLAADKAAKKWLKPTQPLNTTQPVVDTARDESWRRGSIADSAELEAFAASEQAAATSETAAAQPPAAPPAEPSDWEHAAAVLAAALRSCGCKQVTALSTPDEAMGAISALCEPAAFVAHAPAPRNAHETADNAARRHRAQRDPRAAPIVPRPEAESDNIFSRRLNATRSLVDLRAGPQRVLVLPQQPREPAALAIARLDAQATCPAIVMPVGPHEDAAAFEERLDALRATPRPAEGGARCAPVLPRGKHESGASFALRLEVAPLCTVVVPPQPGAESDADAALRLEAQRLAPHADLPPYAPYAESHEEFTLRCTPAAPADAPSKRRTAAPSTPRAVSTPRAISALGKRPSSERCSATARRQATERLDESPRRMRQVTCGKGVMMATAVVSNGSAATASVRSSGASGRSGRSSRISAARDDGHERASRVERRLGALAKVGRSLTRMLSVRTSRVSAKRLDRLGLSA